MPHTCSADGGVVGVWGLEGPGVNVDACECPTGAYTVSRKGCNTRAEQCYATMRTNAVLPQQLRPLHESNQFYSTDRMAFNPVIPIHSKLCVCKICLPAALL